MPRGCTGVHRGARAHVRPRRRQLQAVHWTHRGRRFPGPHPALPSPLPDVPVPTPTALALATSGATRQASPPEMTGGLRDGERGKEASLKTRHHVSARYACASTCVSTHQRRAGCGLRPGTAGCLPSVPRGDDGSVAVRTYGAGMVTCLAEDVPAGDGWSS